MRAFHFLARKSNRLSEKLLIHNGFMLQKGCNGSAEHQQDSWWANTPGRIRTCDLSFRKAALYPTELLGQWCFRCENPLAVYIMHTFCPRAKFKWRAAGIGS